MATSATTAVSNLSMILLGGAMTIKVDALTCKKQEETVGFKMICPIEGEPTRPRQMYVHPDDVDSTNGPVRMWTESECDKARDVDGVLYRVTPEEIAAAKEPVLPSGEITITIHPADQVDALVRPTEKVYRLRPKNVPHVYAMLVDLVADDSKAYLGELTIRGKQCFYRLQSWNGVLVLQEHLRPGEFYDAEDYSHDYPAALLAKMQGAVDATVSDFKPDEYVSFLRDRAAALDAAKRDPDAKPVKAPKAAKPKDTVEDLMAMLDNVAASAKPKKAKAK